MATTAPRPSAGLPTELTSFIGRERELQELAGLMARSRLITLTGAAGSGKTRLALQLVGRAGELAGLPGPVRWVELASLRDAGLVVPAVAEAMGLREEVRGGDLAALVRLLHTHRALLVLDNCEHLVDDVAALVDGLLRQCPDLAILATSREALGVPGERAWLVPPLSVPRRDDPGDPTAAEAVRLFVERAADVVPGFALTPDNQDAVVEICRRLDGIPLAIELAAARIRVLSAADIRDRLDDVFRLLSTGGRTAVPRHRTLRAAIDWSHDLLTEESRALLRRLAVFRGGFGLEGAEAVGPGPGLQAVEVLDVLARLVDRSLVGVREHHGAARYSLLEAVRQYALEQLVASGEEEETRRRHARHVLQRVEEAEPHFIRRERKLWVDRLQPDLDNIRSALAWSREHDPALHVRLVGKLWWFWFSTQHWTEGGRWVDGALRLARDAAPDADDDAADDDADVDADVDADATSSERDRAAILFAAGALAALQVRTEEAQGALREAADLAARLGDERLEAYALNYLGMTYAGEGRAEAMELCRRAETWFREHDDLYGLRLALLLQGSLAAARGAMDDAVRFNEEGVGVARRFGLDRELAVALQNLAAVHLTREQLEPAESLIREAMAASRRDPSYYFIATGLAYLGELECRRGRVEIGARLLGAAEATRERVGAVAFRTDRVRLEGQLPAFRAAIGDDAFDRAWAEGRALRPETLMEEILTATPAVPAPVDTAPAAAAPAAAGRTPAASNGGGRMDRPSPSEPEPLLRVDALGPLEVHVDGQRLEPERWTYAKPRELLLFLLLHPGGSTRDQVGEALWPGAARSNVKNSFHVTLHHLRKTLGHPEWVVTEGDRYRLEPTLHYALDVDRFEAAAAGILAQARASEQTDPAVGPDPATIRETLALCRGEILEGDVAGRWIDDHRDRVRRRVVDLNLALGAALEREDPGAAAELYRALAAREELDEEVHRRLMASWARAGDRVQALRHYDRVVALLRDALDAEPEPGTVALYESIRAGVPV